MDQVLELKNIHYAYHNPDGETPAINGISFILNKGEFVAITGPSGAAEDDENIYLFKLDSQGRSFLRDGYVLSEMHLEMYTINKKSGTLKKESMKDEKHLRQEIL